MATATSNIVHLHWDMKDGLLTVTPEDEDRFGIKVGRAIEILKQAGRADEFKRQFNLLQRVLANWLKDQSGIDRAYLTHNEGALAFVVVRAVAECDDVFEDELSDLDFSIANDADLDLIKLNAIALPAASESAIKSFLDVSFTIEYVSHGDRSGSYSSGEQES